MSIIRRTAGAALCLCLIAVGKVAASERLEPFEVLHPRQVYLCYNPASGGLLVGVGPNETAEGLSAFRLESAGGHFDPMAASFYPPSFPDEATNKLLLHVDFTGFATPSEPWDIGSVLRRGWGAEQLLADLMVDGSYESGGDLRKYGHPVVLAPPECVPEPAALAMLVLGFAGLFTLCHRC